MDALPVGMPVDHRTEDSNGYPGTGVANGCELPLECQELNLSPLKSTQ